MKRARVISGIGTYTVLVIASIVVLIPILWMLSTSLKIESETISIPPKWIPDNPSLEAYSRLWSEYPFLTYFKNSIIIVLSSVFLSVLFSCLAGYGVTRFNFKARKSFLSFLLVTQMFPSIMMLIPYYKVLSTYGINDSLLGMIIVYISFTVPFCSWMMVGFFRTIPLELDEAAIIDGCSRWKAFYKIILPMTLPGIASSAIYAFITGWNEYMFAQVLINSPELKTVPLGIAELNGFYKILWNDMMAASIIASLPLVILFIFLQKYFISGLTAGAVKQ
ncbi:MAG: carbohydrate ABC transporter permease [Clostridiales bacterium]|nr:carbohydrate ABC transporter permease [Clostridiales bacterium]